MLPLPSACACAFVCGGCGLSSALHAGPPASHHALTTIAASHRVVLMLASLEECGTADAHSTPGGHGLTMPRIADSIASAYLVGVGTGEASEIRVPLPPAERALLGVAVLAGGRGRAPGREAARAQTPPLIQCASA